MILYVIYLKARKNRLMLKKKLIFHLICPLRQTSTKTNFRNFRVPILNDKVNFLSNTSRTFVFKIYITILIAVKIF